MYFEKNEDPFPDDYYWEDYYYDDDYYCDDLFNSSFDDTPFFDDGFDESFEDRNLETFQETTENVNLPTNDNIEGKSKSFRRRERRKKMKNKYVLKNRKFILYNYIHIR